MGVLTSIDDKIKQKQKELGLTWGKGKQMAELVKTRKMDTMYKSATAHELKQTQSYFNNVNEIAVNEALEKGIRYRNVDETREIAFNNGRAAILNNARMQNWDNAQTQLQLNKYQSDFHTAVIQSFLDDNSLQANEYFEKYQDKILPDMQLRLQNSLKNNELKFVSKSIANDLFTMCADAVISVANGDMTKQQAAKIIFHFGFFQPFLFSIATSGSLLRWFLTGDDDDFWTDLKMSLTNFGTDSVSFINDLSVYVRNKLFSQGQYIPSSSPLFGDIQKQIAKISKEDITVKDWIESLSYMTLHLGEGINSDSIINSSSGVGDVVTGSPMKGTLKIIGMTDKRASHVTGED